MYIISYIIWDLFSVVGPAAHFLLHQPVHISVHYMGQPIWGPIRVPAAAPARTLYGPRFGFASVLLPLCVCTLYGLPQQLHVVDPWKS